MARVVNERSAGGVLLVPVGQALLVAMITLRGGDVLALPKGHIEPGEQPEQTAVRETREALNMSRQVFGFKIGVNPRTLERWEQGRSKSNEQAAALLWLVRKYPDTLDRLESLAVSA